VPKLAGALKVLTAPQTGQVSSTSTQVEGNATVDRQSNKPATTLALDLDLTSGVYRRFRRATDE
jgi:hypothetical protein